MLKLYHTAISANSRRVWIALLEKEIPFELVPLKLDGDQFQSEFLAINPFHHIPVLVDDDFRLIESLAILDYLEAKYPSPAMLPTNAKDLATVRMVEMVTDNELVPAIIRLTSQVLGCVEENPPKLEQAKQQILKVLEFFESLMDRSYSRSDRLTLADIVAGTVVPMLPSLGVSLDDYSKLSSWSERLMSRPTWQKTQLSQEEIEACLPLMKARVRAYLAD